MGSRSHHLATLFGLLFAALFSLVVPMVYTNCLVVIHTATIDGILVNHTIKDVEGSLTLRELFETALRPRAKKPVGELLLVKLIGNESVPVVMDGERLDDKIAELAELSYHRIMFQVDAPSDTTAEMMDLEVGELSATCEALRAQLSAMHASVGAMRASAPTPKPVRNSSQHGSRAPSPVRNSSRAPSPTREIAV